MKNFIVLTNSYDDHKVCIPLSNIKFVNSRSTPKVYLNDGPLEFIIVKESIEDITEQIEKASQEKAEFVEFLFTNLNREKLCVNISAIRYLKKEKENLIKVFIEGIGEIEVYQNYDEVIESLNSITV